MTNDEYQRIAREERHRQEQEEFHRRLREQQERQQRELRERAEAQRLASQSRSLGRMGAFTLGPVNANEYQQGLWEHQQQRAQKQREEQQRGQRAFRTSQQSAATFPSGVGGNILPGSGPGYRYYPRKKRFVGGITRWFVGRAWPFSALFNLGQNLRYAGRKGKIVAALAGGVIAVTLFLNSRPQTPSLVARSAPRAQRALSSLLAAQS